MSQMEKKPLQQVSKTKTTDELWRSLHIFNLYRLTVIGIITLTFFLTTSDTTSLGKGSPTIFGSGISLWLLIAFISGFSSRYRKPQFYLQTYALIFTDICFITALIYASDDITSGLGALMMVTIAVSGILLSGRVSFAFASFATLAIFTTQGYRLLLGEIPGTQVYIQSGLLGAGLFAVALLAHLLTKRLLATEALAEQRKEELEGLEHINELIIQNMQTGILLIDTDNRIKLMNKHACQLLSLSTNLIGGKLDQHAETLYNLLSNWHHNPSLEVTTFRSPNYSNDVLPRFMSLGGSSDDSTLIFLEDSTKLAQRSQHAKLASLGRLTASIAHEIRNPLSAINHASQLLEESNDITSADQRLTEIISQQTHRLNTIVENILSLSRKKELKPEAINLQEWMPSFKDSLTIEKGLAIDDIQLSLPDEDMIVTFDSTHLNQIMYNLANNGIRHSRKLQSTRLLEIKCFFSDDKKQINIDIMDHGEGIKANDKEKLFEPFFTTESDGTGLGLYISRELSQLNHAHLQHIDNEHSGAQFRITLANNIL